MQGLLCDSFAGPSVYKKGYLCGYLLGYLNIHRFSKGFVEFSYEEKMGRSVNCFGWLVLWEKQIILEIIPKNNYFK